MGRYFSIFLGLVMMGVVAHGDDMREWTNSKGQSIEASLVKQQGSKVTLKLKNGRTAVLDKKHLSQEDQDYLAEMTAKKEDKTPSHIVVPDRWPTQVKGPEDIKLRESKAKTKIDGENWITYQSKHFKFSCQTALSEEAQDEVGRLFENTWSAIRAMPLPFHRVTKDGRNLESRLVKNRDEYLQKGGHENSAGMYTRGQAYEYTMMPYESLNLTAIGELDPSGKINSRVLVHEITHHLTCDILTDTWSTEGVADYVGYIPYNGECLDFSAALEAITNEAKKRGGSFDMPYTFEQFLTLSQNDFYDKGNGGIGASQNYMMGCMAVAFFFHLDGERGIKNFTLYMKNAKGGKDKRALKALLNKRKIEELEEDFIEAWKKQGITIKFKSGSN